MRSCVVCGSKLDHWMDAPNSSHCHKCGCSFCYPREQGSHGEIKREWLADWLQFVPLCRLHASQNTVVVPTLIEPQELKD